MEIPLSTIDEFALELFQILRTWKNKSLDLNVKAFLDRIIEWEERSYISPVVWKAMDNIVSSILLSNYRVSHTQGKQEKSTTLFIKS